MKYNCMQFYFEQVVSLKHVLYCATLVHATTNQKPPLDGNNQSEAAAWWIVISNNGVKSKQCYTQRRRNITSIYSDRPTSTSSVSFSVEASMTGAKATHKTSNATVHFRTFMPQNKTVVRCLITGCYLN